MFLQHYHLKTVYKCCGIQSYTNVKLTQILNLHKHQTSTLFSRKLIFSHKDIFIIDGHV